ncbi:MAG: copper chaperone PCu(A)C [Litorimonas sp.]
MKRLLALSAALVIAACSDASVETDVTAVKDAPIAGTDMAAADAAAPLAVTLSDPYIMAPLKGRDVAAGYFVAENDGAAARLVAATSPVAEVVELHTHSMEGGVMKMREVEGVDLPAGESVTFEPGGLHLMLFGFNREEGQTEAPVTLTFEGGEEMTLSVPIRERE